ncbi:hypothetical protein [Nonomuraea turkmeniaca]|uniref:hypothetical protein n=1 Tax=Nonomuraea turkmeniaca TaxID=103838 RepID=UPI001B8604B4|nr:hypothetical protein [Nonomuraea turkmeniaca]
MNTIKATDTSAAAHTPAQATLVRVTGTGLENSALEPGSAWRTVGAGELSP